MVSENGEATGSAAGKVDRPHVVERHAPEKLMHAQCQAFELSRRDSWHHRYPSSTVAPQCLRR